MSQELVDRNNKIWAPKATIVGYINAMVLNSKIDLQTWIYTYLSINICIYIYIYLYTHVLICTYMQKWGYCVKYDPQWDTNNNYWSCGIRIGYTFRILQVIKHSQLGSPLFQSALSWETCPSKEYFSGKSGLIPWTYGQRESLVGGIPTSPKNMTSSVGMMNILNGKMKFRFQTTNI